MTTAKIACYDQVSAAAAAAALYVHIAHLFTHVTEDDIGQTATILALRL